MLLKAVSIEFSVFEGIPQDCAILDNFTFFSSGFSKSTIKLIEPSALNSIVDGKDITVGWKGWPTDKASEGIY